MNYQVGEVCYPTPLAAVTAMAAAEVGSIKTIGTAQYVVDSTSQTASSITYVFRNVSNAAVVTSTETVTPIPCGLLTVEDGASLGWMVAASFLLTYGVLFLTRALRGETESSYGNS